MLNVKTDMENTVYDEIFAKDHTLYWDKNFTVQVTYHEVVVGAVSIMLCT